MFAKKWKQFKAPNVMFDTVFDHAESLRMLVYFEHISVHWYFVFGVYVF
jgi:hypothetical protein